MHVIMAGRLIEFTQSVAWFQPQSVNSAQGGDKGKWISYTNDMLHASESRIRMAPI